MKKFHEAICAEGMAKKMKKQKKSSAGMSLGVVIVFITLMSVMVAAMLIAASTALRNARVLPEFDGHFYSAEAAMNNALPRIAAELAVGGQTVASEILEIVVPATHGWAVAFTWPLDSDRTATEVLNMLDAHFYSTFTTHYIIRIVEQHINVRLNLPSRTTRDCPAPPPDYVPPLDTDTASPVLGDSFFHLIGDTAGVASAGFGSPAFVNLERGSISRITPPNPNPPEIHIMLEVDGPNGGPFEITITPYITVTSEAGTVVLMERIYMPVPSFTLTFGGGPVIFTGLNHAAFGLFCMNGYGSWPRPYTNWFGSSQPGARRWPDTMCGAWCQGRGGNSNIPITVTVGGNPVPPIPYPPLNHGVTVAGYSVADWGAELRDSIRDGAQATPPYTPSVSSGIINGGAFSPGTNIRLTGSATLVGNFTGINVYAGYNSLTLGLEGNPLIVENAPGNETYIVGNGHMTINVVDGLILEYVSISTNQQMTFQSDPTTASGRNVSMGATFMSGGAMTGTIEAAIWNSAQIPQFYTMQTMNLSMWSYPPGTQMEMGGLFFSIDGSHINVNIDNDGADFDGMIIANTSGTGSNITGHTNLKEDPTPPSMGIRMPQLAAWLVYVQTYHASTSGGGTPRISAPNLADVDLDFRLTRREP